MRGPENGQTVTLGLPGEQDAAGPERDAPLDLLDRGVDVPERRRHHRQQPAEIRRGPLDQEVVVGRHAQQLQLVAVELQEVLAAEAAHVGVQDLRPDPGLVHVRQPGVRPVRARMAVLVGLGVLRGEGRPSRRSGDPDRGEPLALDHPGVRRAVAHDVRHVVAVLGGHPVRPHARGLGDVAVRIDDDVLYDCDCRPPHPRAGVRSYGGAPPRQPHRNFFRR